ncbi:hypothetical protein [Candidatus Rhabdochlamydia porcellionis]|jgi:hypothetical protein|uniref:Uncharacterized protein n=1 Tax=Candidatus Rhabdochlamydia porcellionis TaxID=225148 RepID=A0ABX8Z135_9BACT|nr:hypothetical protein [Candidatus Rhabdochlamydia porcellionis]QZA59391.1 hypothetical protein RHAB15C_0001277 [Candidatus Rhabdochlamydia porcellionis]
MSISDFQATCHTYHFSTSFCIAKEETILPKIPLTQKYIIKFWRKHGVDFNAQQVLFDTSVCFDPKNKKILFPNEEILKKLDTEIRSCVSSLLSCLKTEPLPITKKRVECILGNTVVVLSNPRVFQEV